jgi:hypothetical protein
MSKWLLRGLLFAGVVLVLRLVQGVLVDTHPTQAWWTSPALGLFIAVPCIVWAFFDGRADAKAESDPDRRQDLSVQWLLIGIVAGVVGDLISWIVAQFYQPLYVGGLVAEVVTFASFTALLIFLAGTTSVIIGRAMVDRKAGPYARRRITDEEDGTRADTDVFAAVKHERR